MFEVNACFVPFNIVMKKPITFSGFYKMTKILQNAKTVNCLNTTEGSVL
jgi:hypothetical protein